jgi:hypothetical protein
MPSEFTRSAKPRGACLGTEAAHRQTMSATTELATARLIDLVTIVRALPDDARRELVRAALAQLSELARPEPRIGSRPVGLRSDASLSSIYEPVACPPAPRVVEPPLDRTTEDRMLAILDSSAQPGEPLAFAFRRKEEDLTRLFRTLDVLTARALQRRLASPAPSDELASRFARITPERRARLLGFLGDARRRDALRKAA